MWIIVDNIVDGVENPSFRSMSNKEDIAPGNLFKKANNIQN